MSDVIVRVREAVIGGRHREIETLVDEALQRGIRVEVIINEAMIEAMDVVGKRFANNEIFVPEMLVAAFTMKKGLEVLKPLISGASFSSRGKIVMATVKGDLHDIGKNLVIMMLEGAGFEVIDLGVDQDVESVVNRVAEEKPAILGLSALLTTTMPEMARVIERLDARGIRDQVKVIVGGAPVNAEFAEKIKADGYGKDAVEAVALAREIIK